MLLGCTVSASGYGTDRIEKRGLRNCGVGVPKTSRSMQPCDSSAPAGVASGSAGSGTAFGFQVKASLPQRMLLKSTGSEKFGEPGGSVAWKATSCISLMIPALCGQLKKGAFSPQETSRSSDVPVETL